MNRPQTGFTLIEIMIAVAIIGLLSAIAYPIYRDSIYKGARAEGRAALMDLLQQQERYASQNGSYFAFAKNASSTPFKTYSGENGSGKAKYLLYAETCSSDISIRDCVKLTAEPVQADTVVGKLSLQSTGVKSCDGSAATTPPPTICWP